MSKPSLRLTREVIVAFRLVLNEHETNKIGSLCRCVTGKISLSYRLDAPGGLEQLGRRLFPNLTIMKKAVPSSMKS